MVFPRINCNTTTVTVLTATAATTLSFRVCVLLTMSIYPSSPTQASLVSSVKDTSHKGHGICARSLLGESEEGTGALSNALSQDPADHRRQGDAHGSGRVHGRVSGSASS